MTNDDDERSRPLFPVRAQRPSSLEFRQFDEDGSPVVRCAGKLDTNTAELFGQRLVSAAAACDAGLVLNLNEVSYVTSQGWGAMVKIGLELRRRGARLVLCGLRDEVSVAYDLLGIRPLVPAYESEEMAISVVRRPA